VTIWSGHLIPRFHVTVDVSSKRSLPAQSDIKHLEALRPVDFAALMSEFLE
jgi:hypothetical protein